MMLQLIDTHTHFDVDDFAFDRLQLAQAAKQAGVQALVLIGLEAQRFPALLDCHHRLQQQVLQQHNVPLSLLAPGLHPFYIAQHLPEYLPQLEQLLLSESCVAVGEIGLDTFLPEHKQPAVYAQQQHYFAAQLQLAAQYQKPVILHIRKAHADAIAMLKQQRFAQGGIAHAFSGGVQEAKALIDLGFKLGITGQITNPNAKKLHQVVQAVGAAHLVIETDCPDMTPLCCQVAGQARTRNTPANLPYVLQGLAQSLGLTDVSALAQQLWHNSLSALQLDATFLAAKSLN